MAANYKIIRPVSRRSNLDFWGSRFDPKPAPALLLGVTAPSGRALNIEQVAFVELGTSDAQRKIGFGA